MKRVLLATTALAMFAGAGQAQAGGDLYLSVFGGANFLADSSFFDGDGCEGCSDSFSSDADTGFVLGGAIGTSLEKWAKGLRVEMEVSYRRNDVGGTWTTDGGELGGPIDGNMSTFAIMANTWYDIDVGHKVVPYVGGGVGWARMNGDVQFIDTIGCCGTTEDNEDSNSGFAWQLGLGINYEVMPAVDVGIDYRYFVGPRFDDFFDGKNSDGRLENHNHAVMAHIKIGIDTH
ncbi:MAG: outer membrane beta-barrel protein [Micropepsaceae bacterium]